MWFENNCVAGEMSVPFGSGEAASFPSLGTLIDTETPLRGRDRTVVSALRCEAPLWNGLGEGAIPGG